MGKRGLRAMIIGFALLGAGAGANEMRPDPVAFATQMEIGNLTQAERWLQAGMSPDFMASRIGSGLMIAAWEGNLDLMALFVKYGASLEQSNANGETALTLAAWRGKTRAVDWLLERGARLDPPAGQWGALHYAAFAGHLDLVEKLLARGADINARSPNGSTALMLAIYDGHATVAGRLLEKGAQRDLKNDWGDGAMEWAMRFDRLDIAKRLATPDEYRAAVDQPREKWGDAQRSLAMSADLQQLFRVRARLAEKGMSLTQVDERIAAERARIVRREFNRQALPPRATRLEITASQQSPDRQSAKLVEQGGQAVPAAGFKVPPASFSGRPRMPAKAPTRNY